MTQVTSLKVQDSSQFRFPLKGLYLVVATSCSFGAVRDLQIGGILRLMLFTLSLEVTMIFALFSTFKGLRTSVSRAKNLPAMMLLAPATNCATEVLGVVLQPSVVHIGSKI